jgi:hypothetical protein
VSANNKEVVLRHPFDPAAMIVKTKMSGAKQCWTTHSHQAGMPKLPLHTYNIMPITALYPLFLDAGRVLRNPTMAACNVTTQNPRTLLNKVDTWVKNRNQEPIPVDRQFTTDDARIKLKQLYPAIQHSQDTIIQVILIG